MDIEKEAKKSEKEKPKIRFRVLVIAAIEGDVAVFESLSFAQLNKFINRPGSHQRSLLHYAASSSYFQVVKFLVEGNGRRMIDARDKDGDTPLHYACSFGCRENVHCLLTNGADINAVNNRKLTALHRAALRGMVHNARMLLYHGADVNAADKKGFTPLHLAATSGNLELCEMLVNQEAQFDARTDYSFTPFMIAIMYKNVEVVKFLESIGATVEVQDLDVHINSSEYESEERSPESMNSESEDMSAESMNSESEDMSAESMSTCSTS